MLERLDASAVTLLPSPSDGATDPVLEPDPGATPMWSSVQLQALFTLDTDVGWLRTELAGLPSVIARSIGVDFLEDEDWLQRWRQHAVEACFASRLWLLPKDAEPPANAEHVLYLDPGLAFGSGGHATTRLCLQWLAQAQLDNARVLDYGCGSGVLGLAALSLGAATVDAVDHDPQALTATQDNGQHNGQHEAQLKTWLPGDLPDSGRYDVVLANILANPLMQLAAKLSTFVSPGGFLVLAGMLRDQVAAVAAAYPDLKFDVVQEGDWVCMVAQRPMTEPA